MRGRGLGQEFSFASKQVCSHVGVLPNQPYQRWAFYLWLMRILQKWFFFSCLWNAPDCTKRDVQLYSKNVKSFLSGAPLNSCTHEHLLQSLSYKSKQRRMKSIILWILTSTGTRFKLHVLPSPISPQFLYLSHHSQSQSPSPVKAVRVTAGFSPMDPCQLQILIKRLCDSAGDNLCLSPREVKMLWKEFLHGYGSTLKLSATPLGSEDVIKGT